MSDRLSFDGSTRLVVGIVLWEKKKINYPEIVEEMRIGWSNIVVIQNCVIRK